MVAELATFAVFEPFLGGLVTADVEIPGEFGHIAEVLGLVNPDFIVVIFDITDNAITGDWESGFVFVNNR